MGFGSLECTSLSGLASRTYAADMASYESHLSPPASISQQSSTRGWTTGHDLPPLTCGWTTGQDLPLLNGLGDKIYETEDTRNPEDKGDAEEMGKYIWGWIPENMKQKSRVREAAGM